MKSIKKAAILFISFVLVSVTFETNGFSVSSSLIDEQKNKGSQIPVKSSSKYSSSQPSALPADVYAQMMSSGSLSSPAASVSMKSPLPAPTSGTSKSVISNAKSNSAATSAKSQVVERDPLKKPYGKPVLKSSRVENVTDHGAKLIYEFEWRYWIGDSNGSYEPRIVYTNQNGVDVELKNQYAKSIGSRQVQNPEYPADGLSLITLYTWRVEASVTDLLANKDYGGNGVGSTALMYIYPKNRTDGMQNAYQQKSPSFLTLRDKATLGAVANFKSSSIVDRVHPLTGVDMKASIQMANVLDAQQNMALRIKSSDSSQVVGPAYFLPRNFSGDTASFAINRSKPTQATTFTFEVYDLRTGQIIKTATATYTPSESGSTGSGGTGTGGTGTGTGTGGSSGGGTGQTTLTKVRFNAAKPITTKLVSISGSFQSGSPVGKIMLYYLDPKTGKSVWIGTQSFPTSSRVYSGSFNVSWNTEWPSKLINGKYKVLARVYGTTGALLGSSDLFEMEIKK